MAVMVMLYTTVLSTKMRNADGRSGHGGGEAEDQWIKPRNLIPPPPGKSQFRKEQIALHVNLLIPPLRGGAY